MPAPDAFVTCVNCNFLQWAYIGDMGQSYRRPVVPVGVVCGGLSVLRPSSREYKQRKDPGRACDVNCGTTRSFWKLGLCRMKARLGAVAATSSCRLFKAERFLVCPGRCLSVSMTAWQEAEEAGGTPADEEEDPERYPDSAFLEYASSQEDGSESLAWMKQAARCVQ